MKLTDVIINNTTLGTKLLLVDVTPSYEYKEGKKTSNIVAHKYKIVLPEKSFDQIFVKIDGPALLEKPTGHAEVAISGLYLYIYWSQGEYRLAATGTGITIVTAK